MPLCASIWRSFSCRRSRIGAARIILFEGPEGSGKKYALKQLAAAFDPCHFAVHSIGFDRREASEGHWLARFWRSLAERGPTPRSSTEAGTGACSTTAFSGASTRTLVARSFDEINEFEAQQRDYGTLIVKLYFEVSAEVQEQRLARRAANPVVARNRAAMSRSATDDPGLSARVRRRCKANSDTRWSPWVMIDGNDEEQAAVAALSAIADAWAAGHAGRAAASGERARSAPNPGSGSRSLRSFSRPRAAGRSARRRPWRRSAPWRAARSSRSGHSLASAFIVADQGHRAAVVVLVGKLDRRSEADLVARFLRRRVDDLRRLHDRARDSDSRRSISRSRFLP